MNCKALASMAVISLSGSMAAGPAMAGAPLLANAKGKGYPVQSCLRIQEILDSRCATCHTDRRFSRVLGWERQPILSVVARMASHPGANIPADEFGRIQAAVTMLQCTRCHNEAVLSRLAMQTPQEQVSTIRRMQRLPESGIRSDQIPEIVLAFRTLSGQR